MAEQAIAIIKALGYNKINLLGLSMGGFVAQEIVRIDAELGNTLTLAGTGPRAGIGVDKVTSVTFKHMANAFFHAEDPKRYIFYNHNKAGKVEAHKVLNRLANRPKAAKDKDMKVSSFLKQLKAIKIWGRAEQDSLDFIKVPTLIVNGDNDVMVPTQNSYEMYEKITNSKLVIYPNAGHGAIFQYADVFSKELLNFLND